MRLASIFHLVRSCRPSTIKYPSILDTLRALATAIMTIVICPIKGQSCWSWSHRFIKGRRVFCPSLAHRYSSTTIIFKVWMTWVEASFFSVIPSLIFRCFNESVKCLHFEVQTSTASCLFCLKIAGLSSGYFPAIAQAYPNTLPALPFWIKGEHKESRKSLMDDIDGSRHAHLRCVLLRAVGGLAPVGGSFTVSNNNAAVKA